MRSSQCEGGFCVHQKGHHATWGRGANWCVFERFVPILAHMHDCHLTSHKCSKNSLTLEHVFACLLQAHQFIMSCCEPFIGLTNCWLIDLESLDLFRNPWREWFCFQWIPQQGKWDCVSWWNAVCPDHNLHIHLLWVAAGPVYFMSYSALLVCSTRADRLYALVEHPCMLCGFQGVVVAYRNRALIADVHQCLCVCCWCSWICLDRETGATCAWPVAGSVKTELRGFSHLELQEKCHCCEVTSKSHPALTTGHRCWNDMWSSLFALHVSDIKPDGVAFNKGK